MSYPSQPGYPTPQYGAPQPPQQNNLWLIGGAILVVLIIIMTVILLVVQQTAGKDSADGGDDPATAAEPTDDGGDTEPSTDTETDGGDSGGDAVEMTAEACGTFDMAKFEEVYGAYDPGNGYQSASSGSGYNSLSCTFPNADYTSVSVYLTDYEDASWVVRLVESDAETFTEAEGYEFSEYTEIGDAGSMYSSTSTTLGGSKTINLHVALGSLDVRVYTTLYNDEGIDEAAAIETLEDFIKQCESNFADYM